MELSLIQRLLRHPRRDGFILFNVIVLVLIVVWGLWIGRRINEGVAAIPSILIGEAGVLFLVLLWVAVWIAWGAFVFMRHRRR